MLASERLTTVAHELSQLAASIRSAPHLLDAVQCEAPLAEILAQHDAIAKLLPEKTPAEYQAIVSAWRSANDAQKEDIRKLILGPAR